MPEIFQEVFHKGISISYRDPEYSDKIIQEDPDGKRFILKVVFDEKLKKFVKKILREIPKRANI